jgi:hypothetical protein
VDRSSSCDERPERHEVAASEGLWIYNKTKERTSSAHSKAKEPFFLSKVYIIVHKSSYILLFGAYCDFEGARQHKSTAQHDH